MRIALDTNVLIYAEGVNGPDMQNRATMLLDSLVRVDVVLPAQVIAELFNVLVSKARQPREEAHRQALKWLRFSNIAETSQSALEAALNLALRHRLQVWDALILAAAAEAGCDLLLSEDMQDGFNWRGLTVVNPFANPRSPLLQDALRS